MKRMSEEIKITGMKTIKMTNKVFLEEFNPAFSALANFPSNPKSSGIKYAIKRTVGSVQKAGEAHARKLREICEPHAALTDEGNPKTTADGRNYIWKNSDEKKDAEKKIEDLNNEVIELTVYPVHLKTITNAYNISLGLEINLGEFVVENTELNEQIAEDEKAEAKGKGKG